MRVLASQLWHTARCKLRLHYWWTYRFWPEELPGWVTLIEVCRSCDQLGDACSVEVVETSNK